MPSEEIFQKNLALWARVCPEEAEALGQLECPRTSFCETSVGEPNLRCEVENGPYFLHAQAGALEEAHRWFQNLHLNRIKAICVYGIGLGYIYDAAKAWLKTNEDYVLIFVEDNLEVAHRFLETERATKFLSDPQVFLFTFEHNSVSWSQLNNYLMLFSNYEFEYHPSPTNERLFPEPSKEFLTRFSYLLSLNSKAVSEYSDPNTIVLDNYFHNVLKMEGVHGGKGFFEKFPQIPAIVIGAGPSLDKNIELLKTLNERALIFAGGTGINAANGGNVIPHFCVSLDPNHVQLTRLIMTKSYQTPLIYRNRIFNGALDIMHGEHLFLKGFLENSIPAVFEKGIGIVSDETIIAEGLNVLTFCLNIAKTFGCNPVICVGIDLAYSKGQSYAEKIANHPLYPPKSNLKSKSFEDELIVRKDIHGNDVTSLWKWVGESMWYGRVPTESPGLSVINATEGGIGFPGIPNMTLQQVKDLLLTRTYDFGTWVHGELQLSPFASKERAEDMRNRLKKMSESLKNCSRMYGEIAKALEEGVKHDDEKINALREAIADEEGYKSIIGIFDVEYKALLKIDELRYEWFKEAYTPERLEVKRSKSLLHQVRRLKFGVEINAGKIDLVIKQFDEEKRLAEKWKAAEGVEEQRKLQEKYPFPSMGDAKYEYRDGVLTMVDKECNLNIIEPFASQSVEDLFLVHHDNGAIKVEQYHLDGQLHGPSSFYKDDGTLLARAWFYKGERVGKMWTYYTDGKLHSMQRYAHGVADGLQLYYYPDGVPRSILPHKEGVYDGDVMLFHPSGHLSRLIHYKNGRREGVEKIWDAGGRLLVEVYYSNDLPVGVAKEFYPDGKPMREVTYDENSKQIDIKRWNTEGRQIVEISALGDAYFDKMTGETKKLTNSLEAAVDGLKDIPKVLPSHVNINEGLAQIQETMQQLLKLDKDLKNVLNPENGAEAIWLNKSLQKLLEKEIADQGKDITEGIEEIGKNISDLVNRLKNIPPQGGSHDNKP